MRLLPWHYGTRNLMRSPARSLQTAGGIALVVLLVMAAGAFVRGMRESLSEGGHRRNVILLGAGSEESLERSEIRPKVPGIAAASVPGIAERLGVPFVSPEIHMGAPLLTHAPETTGDQVGAAEHLAILRGITRTAFLVHPEVRILEGGAPGPGEMLVGRLAATKLGLPPERLAIGRELWFAGRAWRVCGTMEAPGSMIEGEIWVDLYDLQVAARRDGLSCVILTLDAEGSFEDVEVFCKRRLDLELTAVREEDYYAGLFVFYRPVQAMAWLTAILIALAGIFGGLNTMYATYAARIRELAALEVLGYRRLALLLALLQESLVASAAGSVVGATLGLLLLDGLAVRFSMGAFAMIVDAPVLTIALLSGLGLGILGTLPPAWRCLRPPLAVALRSL